jgi:hypothetical protein
MGAAALAAAEAEAQHAIPRHSSRGACYEHSHLDLARSPNHRKADPALRRIGCEYSHLDLTTQGPAALRGEHAMNIHTSTSNDLRTTARPIRRFGELAVNIHTSI